MNHTSSDIIRTLRFSSRHILIVVVVLSVVCVMLFFPLLFVWVWPVWTQEQYKVMQRRDSVYPVNGRYICK
jgi:hypothetical protein